MEKILTSEVQGHEGKCKPIWLNKNIVDMRINNNCNGITGFFKLVKKHWLFGYIKFGKEFHGYIDSKSLTVKATEGL